MAGWPIFDCKTVSSTSAFDRLHPRIQKWVYQQQWSDLRDIQKETIAPILAADTDLVISATTAAGKTEAAFLPACTAIADNEEGIGIVYISPLKALINDQYRRLEGLSESLEMRVTPWHGDSPQSRKRRCKTDPSGILLITPESLESLLIREPGWVATAMDSLQYIVIDEYHAFIGSERGCQLMSLLHRLECLLQRESAPIPRIALSATLGDMDAVQHYLRPDKSLPCRLITSTSSKNSLKMQVKGYVEKPPVISDSDEEFSDILQPADEQIADELFELLRGDSHLVFANSRQRTEHFAALLADQCERHYVPNEFFPHHGSLAKELREEVETRLQKENLPTTAVCTMTLELGIDIGKVQSIAQVTAPHSVASLRQRMGRSGRRDEPAILRMFITEPQLTDTSHLADKLRLELLQSIAMIRLLVEEKWYEPADTALYHLSTLLHQILAIIAQWGGVRVDNLWVLLTESGAFPRVSVDQFKALLQQMGSCELISQLGDGQLVLGLQGEKLVDHYTFYAVFNTPEEYRLETQGKTLGTLPIDSPIMLDQHIIFGGRRWLVLSVDSDDKVITLEPAKGGRPPKFGGHGMFVHDRVRQEMRRIYAEGEHRILVGDRRVEFIDSTAYQLLNEGRGYFNVLDLATNSLIQEGSTVHIIPWMGDKVVNTLRALLIESHFRASCYAGIIEVRDAEKDDIEDVLGSVVDDQSISAERLATLVPNKVTEKYDHILSDELLCSSYGAKAFDLVGAKEWIAQTCV